MPDRVRLSPAERAAFADCELVAFDLDGTLLCSADYAVDAVLDGLREVLARHGYSPEATAAALPSREAIRQRIGQPFDVFYAGLLPPALAPHAEALHEAIYARQLAVLRGGQAPLFEGARETLAALHGAGYRLALISNASTDYFEAAVAAFELDRWFHYRECLGYRRVRPKSAMLAAALAHCGTRCAAMVGDKAGDFEAAAHHGFPSVAMTHGYGTPDELALATVRLGRLPYLLDLLGVPRPQ